MVSRLPAPGRQLPLLECGPAAACTAGSRGCSMESGRLSRRSRGDLQRHTARAGHTLAAQQCCNTWAPGVLYTLFDDSRMLTVTPSAAGFAAAACRCPPSAPAAPGLCPPAALGADVALRPPGLSGAAAAAAGGGCFEGGDTSAGGPPGAELAPAGLCTAGNTAALSLRCMICLGGVRGSSASAGSPGCCWPPWIAVLSAGWAAGCCGGVPSPAAGISDAAAFGKPAFGDPRELNDLADGVAASGDAHRAASSSELPERMRSSRARACGGMCSSEQGCHERVGLTYWQVHTQVSCGKEHSAGCFQTGWV